MVAERLWCPAGDGQEAFAAIEAMERMTAWSWENEDEPGYLDNGAVRVNEFN